jgi:hypothetical protein
MEKTNCPKFSTFCSQLKRQLFAVAATAKMMTIFKTCAWQIGVLDRIGSPVRFSSRFQNVQLTFLRPENEAASN